MARQSENYDYLYERLQEYYNVSVTGNYPFNIPLNKNGQPIYKFESRIVPIDFDETCKNDIIKGIGFYISKKQDIKKDVRSIDSIFSSRFGMQIDDMTPFGDVL